MFTKFTAVHVELTIYVKFNSNSINCIVGAENGAERSGPKIYLSGAVSRGSRIKWNVSGKIGWSDERRSWRSRSA